MNVQAFDSFASEYDRWYERNKAVYESELGAIGELLPSKNLSSLKGLEVGVGTGRFASKLGVDIGLDPSENMLEISRRRSVMAVQGVAEKLPFHDSVFDVVMMVTAVCFFRDAQAAFDEARRVLKPEGIVVIGFIEKNSELGQRYREKKVKNRFYKSTVFYSAEEIMAFLQKSGFRKFELRQTLFEPLDKITDKEPVREGYGDGSFVAVRATK